MLAVSRANKADVGASQSAELTEKPRLERVQLESFRALREDLQRALAIGTLKSDPAFLLEPTGVPASRSLTRPPEAGPKSTSVTRVDGQGSWSPAASITNPPKPGEPQPIGPRLGAVGPGLPVPAPNALGSDPVPALAISPRPTVMDEVRALLQALTAYIRSLSARPTPSPEAPKMEITGKLSYDYDPKTRP